MFLQLILCAVIGVYGVQGQSATCLSELTTRVDVCIRNSVYFRNMTLSSVATIYNNPTNIFCSQKSDLLALMNCARDATLKCFDDQFKNLYLTDEQNEKALNYLCTRLDSFDATCIQNAIVLLYPCIVEGLPSPSTLTTYEDFKAYTCRSQSNSIKCIKDSTQLDNCPETKKTYLELAKFQPEACDEETGDSGVQGQSATCLRETTTRVDVCIRNSVYFSNMTISSVATIYSNPTNIFCSQKSDLLALMNCARDATLKCFDDQFKNLYITNEQNKKALNYLCTRLDSFDATCIQIAIVGLYPCIVEGLPSPSTLTTYEDFKAYTCRSQSNSIKCIKDSTQLDKCPETKKTYLELAKFQPEACDEETGDSGVQGQSATCLRETTTRVDVCIRNSVYFRNMTLSSVATIYNNPTYIFCSQKSDLLALVNCARDATLKCFDDQFKNLYLTNEQNEKALNYLCTRLDSFDATCVQIAIVLLYPCIVEGLPSPSTLTTYEDFKAYTCRSQSNSIKCIKDSTQLDKCPETKETYLELAKFQPEACDGDTGVSGLPGQNENTATTMYQKEKTDRPTTMYQDENTVTNMYQKENTDTIMYQNENTDTNLYQNENTATSMYQTVVLLTTIMFMMFMF